MALLTPVRLKVDREGRGRMFRAGEVMWTTGAEAAALVASGLAEPVTRLGAIAVETAMLDLQVSERR